MDFYTLVCATSEHREMIQMTIISDDARLKCGARGAVSLQKMLLATNKPVGVCNGVEEFLDSFGGVADCLIPDAGQGEGSPSPPNCKVPDT